MDFIFRRGCIYDTKTKNLFSINWWGKLLASPTVILKGKWLEEAGFKCGEYVEVVVEGEKITLTKTTPPEKTSRQTLEDKIKDLDHEQRKKLAAMIEKL